MDRDQIIETARLQQPANVDAAAIRAEHNNIFTHLGLPIPTETIEDDNLSGSDEYNSEYGDTEDESDSKGVDTGAASNSTRKQKKVQEIILLLKEQVLAPVLMRLVRGKLRKMKLSRHQQI